jgi:hypothetical protein
MLLLQEVEKGCGPKSGAILVSNTKLEALYFSKALWISDNPPAAGHCGSLKTHQQQGTVDL